MKGDMPAAQYSDREHAEEVGRKLERSWITIFTAVPSEESLRVENASACCTPTRRPILPTARCDDIYLEQLLNSPEFAFNHLFRAAGAMVWLLAARQWPNGIIHPGLRRRC